MTTKLNVLAIAAKLDAEYDRVRKMHESDDGSLAADRARQKVYDKISNLGDKLTEIPATNLEEMKLKARYVVGMENGDIKDPVAESIVRDLLGSEPTASEELAARCS